MRVLIVDDNQTNCFILEEMVRNWQMQPAVLTRPEEAVSLLRQSQRDGRPFHLLLLDANMPGMNGLELARQIADDTGMAKVSVILLTSGTLMVDTDERRRLGLSACLTKPVKQSELLDAIIECVGGTKLAEPSHAASTIAELRDRLPRLRILLAEDSLVNQKLALALLAPFGHQVDIANNGAEAVRKWSSQRFDLVLMDVQMPEMDGLEATRAIRAAEEHDGRHTPILALTAHAIKGDRELCLETGMDAYISKPVRAPELYGAIEQLLKDYPQRGTPPEPDIVAAAAGKDGDALDWNAALAASGLDEPTLVDLASVFMTEGRELLGQMRAARGQGDLAALTRVAHTLKSNSSLFSAPEAVEAAQRLEQLARSGDMTGISETAEVVDRECQRLLSALAHHVTKMTPAD